MVITTWGYGVIGACFKNAVIIAPLTATIGLAASIYDEVKKKGMDLSLPGMGILMGGLMGSLFDANNYFHNALAYTGATIGGLLGFYKSYLTREKVPI